MAGVGEAGGRCGDPMMAAAYLAGLGIAVVGAWSLAYLVLTEAPEPINPLEPRGVRRPQGYSYTMAATGHGMLAAGLTIVFATRASMVAWVAAFVVGIVGGVSWGQAGVQDRRQRVSMAWMVFVGNWRKLFRQCREKGLCYYCGRALVHGRLIMKADAAHDLREVYLAHARCLERYESRVRGAAELEVVFTEDLDHVRRSGIESIQQRLSAEGVQLARQTSPVTLALGSLYEWLKS